MFPSEKQMLSLQIIILGLKPMEPQIITYVPTKVLIGILYLLLFGQLMGMMHPLIQIGLVLVMNLVILEELWFALLIKIQIRSDSDQTSQGVVILKLPELGALRYAQTTAAPPDRDSGSLLGISLQERPLDAIRRGIPHTASPPGRPGAATGRTNEP